MWVLSRNEEINNHTIEGFINEVIDRFFEKEIVRTTVQGEVCHGTGGPYSATNNE
jgi:hypothetical protein